MFKAGMKKELLFFGRSFRLWGVLIGFISFALLDPLMIKGLEEMYKMTGIIPETMGMPTLTMSDGLASGIADITSTGYLICMLVMMGTAGGELKKRSTIIPNCSGLTPSAYLIPKFVFYPLFVLVTVFISVILCSVFASAIFAESIALESTLVAAASAAVYSLFNISLYLMLGLSTGRAGIAVATCFLFGTLLGTVFQVLGVDKFHPYALQTQATLAASGAPVDYLNLFGSIGVTVIIIVIFYLVTLFVFYAKRVDNRGNEKAPL